MYWEWRTYKHQQGSLVWKPKQFETISFYYYLMIMRVYKNSSPTVSFKVS